jgi:hypothetical protein
MSQKTFDRQSAKFIARITENLPEGLTAEKMQYWINHPKELQEKLSKLLTQDTEEEVLQKILQKGVTIPALTETFDPQREFTQDEKVKYYFEENFKQHIFNVAQPFKGIEKRVVYRSNLEKHTTPDTDIMAKIGVSREKGLLSREEILWMVHYLTHQQPNGEVGLLNIKLTTIIGYFICEDDVIRVVCAFWRSTVKEWGFAVHDLCRWDHGFGILSHKRGLKF